MISFASKGWCDATVAIVGPEARVVRHLGSGLLGPNAPQPFQQDSLSQKLVWDGRDDGGQPAGDGPFAVHVGLGLDCSAKSSR